MPSAENLDAVTIDAFGTLLLLEDPTPRLRQALAVRGVERSSAAVAAAFRDEAAYYRPRSMAGRDAVSLAALRTQCVAVFLDSLDARLPPETFVGSFMKSIVFHVADGALDTLAALRGAGFAVACVANWDVSLHDHLARLGLTTRFDVALSSAEAAAEKPDPAIFELALDQLGVSPARALHVGDEPVDELGAARAGMAYEPPPLATLPERLGLR